MNIIDLHVDVWRQLQERRTRLPHAILFSGPRGTGKSALARHFAESLLCEAPLPSKVACGSCLACRWLQQGNHPDFRLVQPEALDDEEPGSGNRKKPSQQITVDQIRELDDFLHVGTHRHGVRIVLVSPADAMNRPTANALLKSLEEPPPGTLFLLITEDREQLLPTIRSRCQHVSVPLPANDRSLAWIAGAGAADGSRWLALAGGAPLLAVELGGGDERLLVDALVAELAHGHRLDPMAAANAIEQAIKAEKRPAPLKQVIGWIQKWGVDLLLVKMGEPPRYFTAYVAVLRQVARFVLLEDLLAFSRKALQYRLDCEQPLNTRLFFEEVFLNYLTLFRSDRDACIDG